MRLLQKLLAAGLLTSLVLSHAMAQTREDADALYVESKWQEAADAYQAVVTGNPQDSAAWFGLAQANHQLEKYGQAAKAYRKAEETGFQPVLRINYHLARAYMSMGEDDKALEQIEAIGAAGGISSNILLAVALFVVLSGINLLPKRKTA